MANYTGGCLCGAVRYEINGEPVRTAMCHCDDCRRVTGSAYATNFFFKADDIVVTKGTTKSFQHKGDSGNTLTKEFCPECGSPIFNSSAAGTGVKGVKAGTLDDVKGLRPQIEVYVSRRLPFTVSPDDTEKFERGRAR